MINVLLSRGVMHEPWAYVFLKNYIKKDDKVLIIPFAFGNWIKSDEDWQKEYGINGNHYERMQISFLPYEIKEENISYINYFLNDRNYIVDKIKEADVIYFPGGLPDVMMKRIKELVIVEELEKFKGVMIGSSAGAMIQFGDYHITPDDDYKSFQLEKGLNIITDFGIEVHYTGKKRQRKAIHDMKAVFNRDYYGIPDDGMIIKDGNKVYAINTSKKISVK